MRLRRVEREREKVGTGAGTGCHRLPCETHSSDRRGARPEDDRRRQAARAMELNQASHEIRTKHPSGS